MRLFILTIFVIIAVALAAAQGEEAKCSPKGGPVSILHLYILGKNTQCFLCIICLII